LILPIASLLGFIALLVPDVRNYFSDGLEWVYLLLLSFLLSFPINGLLIPWGHRFSLVDFPDHRKKHGVPTPLTGGLGILIAFSFTVLINFHFSLAMKGVLLGGVIIFISGFVDDKVGLSAKLRLFFQLAAALILIFFGVRVTFVPDYLGGFYVESLITLIWILGITNSMNFLDGIDGLAAGVSMLIAGFFAVFAIKTGQTYLAYLCIALAGSCLGFFFYNFRPHQKALTFLGDGGSNFLGFFLASVAIMGDWAPIDKPGDLVVPAIIMGVLIFDMTLTTVLRIRTGTVRSFSEWIHFTGRDHFHHRLTDDLGFTPHGAAILIFLTCLVSGFGALALKNATGWDSFFILLQSLCFFFLIAFLMLAKKK